MELTTGQMIDHLYEKGGKFVDQYGNHIEWSPADMRIKNSANGETIELNRTLRFSIWSKVPEYVKFDEAMKALKEGKTITQELDEKTSWKYRYIEEDIHVYIKEIDGWKEWSTRGLRGLEGKWSIEN